MSGRGHVFVCTGTLVEPFPTKGNRKNQRRYLHWLSWSDTADHFGFHYTKQDFKKYAGMSSGAVIDGIVEEQGLDLDADSVLAYKEERYSRMSSGLPIDCVLQRMQTLQDNSAKVVVVGNKEAHVKSVLKKLSLEQGCLLGNCLIAEGETKSKQPKTDTSTSTSTATTTNTPQPSSPPEPTEPTVALRDCLLDAAARLDLPPSSCVVYVSTKREADISRKAGMQAIDVTHWAEYPSTAPKNRNPWNKGEEQTSTLREEQKSQSNAPRATPATNTTNTEGIREKGRCMWYDSKKGYGFVRSQSKHDGDQEELFVHQSGIVSMGFRRLLRGQKVTYIRSHDKSRNQLRAIEVHPEAVEEGDGDRGSGEYETKDRKSVV